MREGMLSSSSLQTNTSVNGTSGRRRMRYYVVQPVALCPAAGITSSVYSWSAAGECQVTAQAPGEAAGLRALLA